MLALSETDFTLIVVAAIGGCASFGGQLVNAFTAYRGRKVTADRLDTGNAKAIGETVHDIAQSVEAVIAQGHTNTRELLAMSSKVDRHLEESAPMAEWVKRRMEEEDS